MAKLPKLTPRNEMGHKGSYGNALLIGGSRGMAGAIAIAAMAALRTGAGLVHIAVPDLILDSVAAYTPCAMTIPLSSDEEGRINGSLAAIEEHVAKATCVAIGPGLGQSKRLATWELELLTSVKCPLVIDADGLNNLMDAPDWAKQTEAALVLTPHPGEWQRLSGVSTKDRSGQIAAADDFARRNGAVVVLKGHRTYVSDGRQSVTNTTGTPAMATGGSGDALTGIITALICQGLAPFEAAHLGVHVHGLAGELAARQMAAHVVLPTDLIASLPLAFARLR